ncbi:c-type cytochrome [Pseudomonas sp. RA_15y_Pfl2_54]|uniref:c-type cytochrome n=1 Tax=Pseudomonas sp. RA_15y_Pfl2_54 TaxID=3088704 RepID=UPI0030DB2115
MHAFHTGGDRLFWEDIPTDVLMTQAQLSVIAPPSMAAILGSIAGKWGEYFVGIAMGFHCSDAGRDDPHVFLQQRLEHDDLHHGRDDISGLYRRYRFFVESHGKRALSSHRKIGNLVFICARAAHSRKTKMARAFVKGMGRNRPDRRAWPTHNRELSMKSSYLAIVLLLSSTFCLAAPLDGAALYQSNCAQCHGERGMGGAVGMGAMTPGMGGSNGGQGMMNGMGTMGGQGGSGMTGLQAPKLVGDASAWKPELFERAVLQGIDDEGEPLSRVMPP